MSFSLAPPPPPKTADNQLVETDFVAYRDGTAPFAGASFTSAESAVAQYRDLFFAAPAIGAAIGYANLPDDVREAIWAQIDYAESNGAVQDVAQPADYPSLPFEFSGNPQQIITLTRPEALAIVAAKTAHTLYHEVHRTFPWRITGYSDTEMLALLGVVAWMGVSGGTWDWAAPGGTVGGFWDIADYSPNIAYAKAQPNYAPANNASEAVGNLIDNVGRTLQHGNPADSHPNHACDLVDQFDAQNYNVNASRYIARHGCHSAGPIIRALAQAINVPASYRSGYGKYYLHSSVDFPSVNFVLAHGDEIYSRELDASPGKRLCAKYDYYVANVYTLPPDDPATHALTWRAFHDRVIAYPGSATLAEFSANGWASLRHRMEPYYLGEESVLDSFYHSLATLTGSDGGGGPAVPPAPTIVVDAGTFAQWAQWSISPDPGFGNDTGTGNASFTAPLGDYTLTWLDTYPLYDPPTPPTEGPLTLVTDGRVTFGPPQYVLEGS